MIVVLFLRFFSFDVRVFRVFCVYVFFLECFFFGGN